MATEYFYFGEEYYFCLLRPYYILSELKYLVLNNLPLDDIKIPIKTYNKDDATEFMDDFKPQEQEKSFEILTSIVTHLEKNKFKISLDRKLRAPQISHKVSSPSLSVMSVYKKCITISYTLYNYPSEFGFKF